MKIEKINENQIRCTLTREDLDHRQLKISELAYGTEKAKSLFREMMQQASYEFGFEAEDIPLMIEAIPLSSEAIVLVITKVDCPEELDTRFSNFSDPSDEYDDYYEEAFTDTLSEGADNILDLFQKITQQKSDSKDKEFIPLKDAIAAKDVSTSSDVSIPMDLCKLFSFDNMDILCDLSRVVSRFYDDYNTLYKKPQSSRYYLSIHKGHHTPEDFNKICNILSEYSQQERYSSSTEAFMTEHFDCLIKDHALQTLSNL